MAIFITGATGYIGAHIAAGLLLQHKDPLNLMVRAKDEAEARLRLWRALQPHMSFTAFSDSLASRIRIFRGDITEKSFGLDAQDYRDLVHSTDSVIHCAASLNRKSEKSCLNVNLRGTLETVQLAKRSDENHGLRRFSQVSTVAVAGERSNEMVTEDASIDWNRRDYDPYGRTKKFCEHMAREVLAGVPHSIFRPSIVLGDSRRPQTTQFDMVRAFVFLAGLPVLPLRSADKVDIVPVDFVADAIVAIHQKAQPKHEVYHLSSGAGSQTYRELTNALSAAQGRSGPIYLPVLERPFTAGVDLAAGSKGNAGRGAALLKVFLPYLTWNTVFDNSRVVAELGRTPAPFSKYCYPLLKFSKDHRFTYPYQDWPAPAD